MKSVFRIQFSRIMVKIAFSIAADLLTLTTVNLFSPLLSVLRFLLSGSSLLHLPSAQSAFSLLPLTRLSCRTHIAVYLADRYNPSQVDETSSLPGGLQVNERK